MAHDDRCPEHLDADRDRRDGPPSPVPGLYVALAAGSDLPGAGTHRSSLPGSRGPTGRKRPCHGYGRRMPGSPMVTVAYAVEV
jgi:hypothetical protein